MPIMAKRKTGRKGVVAEGWVEDFRFAISFTADSEVLSCDASLALVVFPDAHAQNSVIAGIRS